MELMQVTGGSSGTAWGEPGGCSLRGLQGRHLPDVLWEMRDAEWRAPGQREQPLPLGLFLRKRQWGKGNVRARPLLETLPTGAQSTSPRKAEIGGSCRDRSMSLLRSLKASPHACEALQPARSFQGALGALPAQTNREQVADIQSGGLHLPTASRTHCHSPPVGIFIKNLLGCFFSSNGHDPTAAGFFFFFLE